MIFVSLVFVMECIDIGSKNLLRRRVRGFRRSAVGPGAYTKRRTQITRLHGTQPSKPGAIAL
jgi:hypothetical protein